MALAPADLSAIVAKSSNGNEAVPQGQGHIWVILGPAGCGKTTVATHLSEELSLPYLEGDKFHPPENIEKMANGTPLTDADRWDWLISLRQRCVAEITGGATGVVLTCSALKQKYRDVLRVASFYDQQIIVHFVYLQASEATLLQRVRNRKGHYMKDDMVRSQFAVLEEPTPEEKDVLSVNVTGTPPEVNEAALTMVKQTLAKVVKDVHVSES